MNVLSKLSSNDPRFTHLDLVELDVDTTMLKAIAEKLEENTFVIRVSWREGFFYDINLKQKIEKKVDLNYRLFQRHPNEFIHSLLSKHVYYDCKEGCNVEFPVKESLKNVELWNNKVKGWQVHEVFDEPHAGRYYSVAYLNEDKKQIVLAHRGTTLQFWDLVKRDSPLKTDLDGVLGGKIVAQQEKAFVVTERVIKLVKDKGYNISFTGHSLGAWLAELSLYFAVKNFGHFESKAVTFDSPGSVSTLQSFEPNVLSDDNDRRIRSLDITTFLSAPNFVNCCDRHIGKVYRVFPNVDLPARTDKLRNKVGKIPVIKNLEPKLVGFLSLWGHFLTPIIETFDPITGKPQNFKKVRDWPHINYQPTKNNSTVGTLIKMTLNSVPVLKFLPGIGRWAYEVIPKPTVWKVLEVFDHYINGSINSQEFWEVYHHLDPNSKEGFPLRGTDLLPPETQFNLLYKGHYCTQEFNPFKDVCDSKSSDWYLNQLSELSYKKIDKKEVDGCIKRSLQNLKNQYNIRVEGNLKYICVTSSDVKVDDLREEILKLCERYKEVKAILDDKNAYSPLNKALNQSPMIISDLPPPSGNILERPKVLKDIGKALGLRKHLIISGFCGTGKSTSAKEYGHYVKEHYGQIVRFIMADSVDKINDAYKSMVENELKIIVTGQEPKHLMQLVHSRIANSRYSVLFIFDNVESFQDVKDYIEGIHNVSNLKLIITTRKMNFCDDLNLQRYVLDPFTSTEAKTHLKNNLEENRFSPQDIEYLITNLGTGDLCTKNLGSNNIGEESFVLPHSISHAVAHFSQRKFCSVKTYIKHVKENDDPLLLFDLLNTSKLAFHVLQYAAYLDPDFISIDILKEVLGLDEETLEVAVDKLEGLSLVTKKIHQNGQYGLQLHRLVQHSVKKFAHTHKNLQNWGFLISERAIFEKLVQVLSRIFPIVTEDPNDDWQTAQTLYAHAVKILQYKISCNRQDEMLKLYVRLGIYSLTVACDFTQALLYLEKALELSRNMPESTKINDIWIIWIILSKLSTTFCKLNENTKALAYETNALEIARKLNPGKNHPYIANSLHSLSSIYTKLDEPRKGLKCGKEALKMRQALYPGQIHPKVVSSLNNIFLLYEGLGEAAKGLEYGEKALEMSRELYSGYHPNVATILNNLGQSCVELGETAKGQKYLQEALAMRQALYSGKIHPDIALTLHILSLLYSEVGDTAKSLKYGKEALELRQALYPGMNHPDIANSLNNLSLIHTKHGEAAKGLKYGEKALEMKQALHAGQNHPDILSSLNSICLSYVELGDMAKGLEYGVKALDMSQALHPRMNHPETANSLNNMSFIYTKLGEAAKGLKYGKKALKMRQALHAGQNHPDVVSSLNSICLSYVELGNMAKGLEYGEKALDMSRALYPGMNHPETANSLINISSIYTKLGEAAKGLKYEKQALEMRQALHHIINRDKIATSLHNPSSISTKLDEPADGSEYLKEEVETKQGLHHKTNHSNIAKSVDTPSSISTKRDEPADGSEYLKEEVETKQALYHRINHSNIATSVHTPSSISTKRDEPADGSEYLKEEVETKQALYHRLNHNNIATSVHNPRSISTKLDEPADGLEYLKEEVETKQALHHRINDTNIATSLHNSSSITTKLDEPADGFEYLREEVETKQALHHKTNHSNIATSVHTPSSISTKRDEPADGSEYLKEEVETKQALYHRINHNNIATSVHNPRSISTKLDEPADGLEYLKEEVETIQAPHQRIKYPEILTSLGGFSSIHKK